MTIFWRAINVTKSSIIRHVLGDKTNFMYWMVIKAILNNVAKKESTHISNEKRNPLFERIENHQEIFFTKWKNQGYV